MIYERMNAYMHEETLFWCPILQSLEIMVIWSILASVAQYEQVKLKW